MATFAITVDVSTLATALELYYTYVLPDGTISSPPVKYTGVGIGGFIALPPTPHAPGYTYTINNVSLNNNTVYNFEVKQFCVDNTIEYSPIDEDHYRTNCVDLLLNVGGFNYQNEEYPIVATWAPGFSGFNPNNYSIQDYTLNVKYTVLGTVVIDTIVVPSVPATNPGSGYVYNITSDDLSNPLEYGATYEVAISFTVILGDGSIVDVDCAYKSITIPILRTYKVHGSEGWIVDWIDENDIHQRACNLFNNATNPPTRPCEAYWILVYHRVAPGAITSSNPANPICGYCIVPGTPTPNNYRSMYLPNPTIYDSDRVNCYPVNAGSGVNPSAVPCNCADVGNNNIGPGWGATWELIGDGYVTILGAIPPDPCIVNNVCVNAPNW
jgi:hypothetical protein